MSRSVVSALAMIFASAFVCPVGWGAETVAPLGPSHLELSCDDCHLGEPYGKRVVDCDECHDSDENLHPVNILPTIDIPGEFTLNEEGELICRSCHQLHGSDEETGALLFINPEGSRDRNAYCAQCHGEKLSRTNPHQADLGERRCSFCHAASGDNLGGRGTARSEIVKLCDFCHGALNKGHPRNVDPGVEVPSELPRNPDGGWSCVTCHEPHGTTSTTHYIRPKFAEAIEWGRAEYPHLDDVFVCKACHTSSFSDEIRAAQGYALRFKGDIGILCVSCHVTDRGHHPTGLKLPEAMKKVLQNAGGDLRFDGDNRIDCYTCHDNSCDTGSQRMRLRHYDRAQMRTDLCWLCHEEKAFVSSNPHVDDPTMCLYCHESQPVPGVSKSLLTVAEMVCLHCHRVGPHPGGSDHLKKPDGKKIQPTDDMPLDPHGEVTCTSCHEPHQSKKVSGKRLRYPAEEICTKCHWN